MAAAARPRMRMPDTVVRAAPRMPMVVLGIPGVCFTSPPVRDECAECCTARKGCVGMDGARVAWRLTPGGGSEADMAIAAPDVLVIGAGVSGLSCGQAVAAAGRGVLLLDRARGVGGRCATHRLLGMPFDLGVSFLHGRDPDFLAAVRAACPRRTEGWPRRVQGTGRPCQPEAFRPGEQRIAAAEGVTAFPRHLADGLPVRTGARVE